MPNINKYIPSGTEFKEVDINRSGQMDITIAEAGSYTATFLQTNAHLDIRIHLMGKGARCRVNAVYLSSAPSTPPGFVFCLPFPFSLFFLK